MFPLISYYYSMLWMSVDTVRWIRQDSIAVGCFQLDDDGEEENYVVQVITSRGRRITDVSVQFPSQFCYLFKSFVYDWLICNCLYLFCGKTFISLVKLFFPRQIFACYNSLPRPFLAMDIIEMDYHCQKKVIGCCELMYGAY